MPNLCGSRFGLEGRLAVATFSDETPARAGLPPYDSCREYQRLRQHLGVLERHVVIDGVALTRELLDEVHLVGMEVPAASDPCGVDEADGIEHERIAVPVPHRVAVVLVRIPRIGAVLAVVDRDHTKLGEAATRIGKLPVEEGNVVLRLVDAPR